MVVYEKLFNHGLDGKFGLDFYRMKQKILIDNHYKTDLGQVSIFEFPKR